MRSASPYVALLLSAALLVACNNSKTPEATPPADAAQSAPAAEQQSAPAEQEQSAAEESTSSEASQASEPTSAEEQSSAQASADEQSAPAMPQSVHLELAPVSSWVEYDLSGHGIPLSVKAPKNLSVDSQKQEGAIRTIIGNMDQEAGTMFMMSIDSYPAEIHAESMKEFEGLREDLTKQGPAALGEQAQQMNVKILQNQKDGVITYGAKDGKGIIIIVAPVEKGGVQGGASATIAGNADVVTEKLAKSVFESLKNAKVTRKK